MGRKIVNRLGHWFYLGDRKRAFQMVFRSPAGALHVLPELAEFCRANEPAPSNTDSFAQGRAAGRRDVWLLISQWTQLTEEEQFSLLSQQGRVRMTEDK